MTPTKSIFSSKTFWINLIMAIIAFSATISPDFLTALGLNSTKVLTIVATVTAILNIILRTLTTTAVTADNSKINQ